MKALLPKKVLCLIICCVMVFSNIGVAMAADSSADAEGAAASFANEDGGSRTMCDSGKLSPAYPDRFPQERKDNAPLKAWTLDSGWGIAPQPNGGVQSRALLISATCREDPKNSLGIIPIIDVKNVEKMLKKSDQFMGNEGNIKTLDVETKTLPIPTMNTIIASIEEAYSG
ncbi:MAG: hypothetical protein RR787_06330, partial [Hydrogenoanaerobacterium sp.]